MTNFDVLMEKIISERNQARQLGNKVSVHKIENTYLSKILDELMISFEDFTINVGSAYSYIKIPI